MVRAPCCEKMGLKKGPWTPEEDQILITHIQKHGHGNWRALPKQAGLLRCGKSCRLRWTNYLRPDIKRGNFTREEEDTIINLHEMLGNRWSAIAAKLPGRTDNEIKNVWHTYLKKRLKQNPTPSITISECDSDATVNSARANFNAPTCPRPESPLFAATSPPQSSSELSSATDLSAVTMETSNTSIKEERMESWEDSFPVIDESFWSDAGMSSAFPTAAAEELQFQFPFSPVATVSESGYGYSSSIDDGMDFWYNMFIRAGGLSEF